MKKALVATVGGSHAPVLVALRHGPWDRVVFVVSEDDPLTGSKGSWVMVEKAGLVCKSSRDATAPDLPAIPVQAALADEIWQGHVLRVPADGITDAVGAILDVMRRLTEEGYAVVGDYTGGTKSMTAALAIAVQLTEGATLQVVAGPRNNLQATTGDLSRARPVLDALRDPLRLAAAERAWAVFDYTAAANLLRDASTVGARRVEALSLGYACWSNLNYGEALDRLRIFPGFVAQAHLQALAMLCGMDAKNRDAVMMHDLSLLAERHAVAGRFDMAVLVLYRTLEGIAQWALRHRHGVDPSNVPADSPFAAHAAVGRDDKLVLGLEAAWTALVVHDTGPLGEAMKGQTDRRRGFSSMRNRSILAHGTTPMGASDWEGFFSWFNDVVRPAFLQAGYRRLTPHPQLPDRPPGVS